tara:strand:- start:855 stop:2201 length:1347 start_codon:yes stop_codon:yes gene_type:complete
MSSKSFNLRINKKISPFRKNIKVDSDKSISIRSFIISAISQNISYIENVLESDDVFSTIKCLQKLGVKILKKSSGKYLVYGKGLGSLHAKKNVELNFGNSGTLARLIIGVLSSTPNIEIRVKGDHSLNKRNMKKLIFLMSKFGATFLPKNKYNFPLKFVSSDMPVGINYKADVSAQLKSAVIFAGLNAYGNTKISDTKKSRDHTENMLKNNKNAIKVKKGITNFIEVFGKKDLKQLNIKVPGDPSSAAFFTALTLLNNNSSLKIKNVCLNKTRIGFYNLLKKKGAKIKFTNLRIENNETRGDIFVQSSILKPIKASKKYYVNSTDEYPILFIVAALTRGISRFQGIGDLANKESNRIKEMQKILKQIGIKSVSTKNDLKIYGKGKSETHKRKIRVKRLGDHRVCMSSFILALLTGATTEIKNFETVNTSSPSFLKIMKQLGAHFEKQK